MLCPLQIDHMSGEVQGLVSGDVVVTVGYKIGPRGPTEATVSHRLRLDGRVIENCATTFKERADVVREPQRREDRAHRTRETRRKVVFRYHQRNAFRYAVCAPHVQNVL